MPARVVCAERQVHHMSKGHKCSDSTKTECAPGTCASYAGSASCTTCAAGATRIPGPAQAQPLALQQARIQSRWKDADRVPAGASRQRHRECQLHPVRRRDIRQRHRDCQLHAVPPGHHASGTGIPAARCAPPGHTPAALDQRPAPRAPPGATRIPGPAQVQPLALQPLRDKADGKTHANCAAGTYASSPGSASCTTCAAGTYASGTGTVSCTPCPTCQTISMQAAAAHQQQIENAPPLGTACTEMTTQNNTLQIRKVARTVTPPHIAIIIQAFSIVNPLEMITQTGRVSGRVADPCMLIKPQS